MKIIPLLLSASIFLGACQDNQSPPTQEETLIPINNPVAVKKTDQTKNVFMQKYAGGYAIEVDGYNSDAAMESYVLKPNGDAKWIYIINDGNGGAIKDSEKFGKWTAEENKISITINGKTGEIIENYVYKNNKFQDDINGQRHLKLVQ